MKSKNINDIGTWWKAYHVEFIFSNVPYHKIGSKFQRLVFIQKPPKFVGKLLYKIFKVSAIRSISVCFSTQIFQKCKFQHFSEVVSFSTQTWESDKFKHSDRNKFQHLLQTFGFKVSALSWRMNAETTATLPKKAIMLFYFIPNREVGH